MIPEAICVLRECLREPRLDHQARRHVERALRLLGVRAQEQAATCHRDSTPCVPDCTLTRGLHGRCGRDQR